jgi:hypothetical protein
MPDKNVPLVPFCEDHFARANNAPVAHSNRGEKFFSFSLKSFQQAV